MENTISLISLGAGIIAAVIAIWQLYLQRKEMRLGNQINSLESLAAMIRNSIKDKQGLLEMNKRKISELEALKTLSEEDSEKLEFHKKEKAQRNSEIKSLYNGLLSVNIKRCTLMGNIEKDLDENVSKAISDMRVMLERRKAEEETRKAEVMSENNELREELLEKFVVAFREILRSEGRINIPWLPSREEFIQRRKAKEESTSAEQNNNESR